MSENTGSNLMTGKIPGFSTETEGLPKGKYTEGSGNGGVIPSASGNTAVKKNLAQVVLDNIPQGVNDVVSNIAGKTSIPSPATSSGERGVGSEADSMVGVHSYDDVIRHLEERMAYVHIPTKEELEKERRRKKTEGIINSISDASRAIANLFATSHYAPHAYKGNFMTEAMQERFNRLKAEREADADKYLNYALTAARLKDAQEQQAYQRGRDKVADGYRAAAEKRAQEQAEFERSLDLPKLQEQNYKTNKAGYDAEKSKIAAEYAPEEHKAGLQLTGAKIATEGTKQSAHKASAANSYASAAAHNRSNNEIHTAWDEEGNEKNFMSKEAADAYAKAHGTYVYETDADTKEYKYDNLGNVSSTVNAKTKQGGYRKNPGKKNKGAGYGNNRGY